MCAGGFGRGSIPDEALLMYVPEEADEFHRKAITALREALGNSLKRKCFADYQPNHAIDRACASCAIADECRTGEQAEQEPVGVVEGSGEWGIAGVLVAGVPIGTKLYAAPVRTKDLTDDEIYPLYNEPSCDKEAIEFARAVIAAYKEKNK